jgi:hypothetical protein
MHRCPEAWAPIGLFFPALPGLGMICNPVIMIHIGNSRLFYQPALDQAAPEKTKYWYTGEGQHVCRN